MMAIIADLLRFSNKILKASNWQELITHVIKY